MPAENGYPADESRLSSLGYAALLLVLLSLLNLGGMIATFTQSPGKGTQGSAGGLIYFSVAGLLGLYLLFRHARPSALTTPFVLFMLFFVGYLVEASTYSVINGNFDPVDMDALIVHAFELFLIATVYFWAASLGDAQLLTALRFAKYALLAGVLSILFSSYLPLYQGAKSDRAAGFFIDANSAAAAALCCLVLIAALPARRHVWTFAQAGAALAAVLMTFSRTGLLALFLLCALFTLDRPSLKAKGLMIAAIIAAGLAVWFLIDTELLPLDFEQRQRLADVGSLLTGDTTQNTSDHRSVLFDIGIEKIKEKFPGGAGMGELHAMEYGVRHFSTGLWLGAHNTYLMILGEAGFVSFALFVTFWVFMLCRIFHPSPFRRYSVGVTIVLLFSMMTTHSVLNDKVAAVVIGFLLATAARVPEKQSAPLASSELSGALRI